MNWINERIDIFLNDWKKHEPFDWKSVIACLIGGIILWPLVDLLPVLGHDWFTFFYPGQFDGLYPPWTRIVMSPFYRVPWRESFSLMNSLTFMVVAVATAREAKKWTLRSRLGAAAMAIITAPLLMILWQGNIDGLILFGLIGLPPGVILLSVKPTIAAWALIARREWMVWGLGFGVITLLLWGFWPATLLHAFDGRYLHPIAMGWLKLGWPVAFIGLVLLIFTDADPIRLMAAGSFLAPYVMPIHYLVLLPAIGRVKGWRRWLLWGWAWVPGLVPAFLGITRYIALGFPFAVWWLLREENDNNR